MISLNRQCLCLNAFSGYRLRFRLEAQGSVLHNLFSCSKAFDTQDTESQESLVGKKTNKQKKFRVEHEVQRRGSIGLCDPNSTPIRIKQGQVAFFLIYFHLLELLRGIKQLTGSAIISNRAEWNGG